MQNIVLNGLPQERLFARYDKMLRIPSVTGSEAEIAAYLHAELEKMGFCVEVWHFDENSSPSLLAVRKGGKPGISLLFAGHMDTVAVTEGWKTDPFVPTVDGDKVYALGAMDMKGGVAAILEAAERFIESGAEQRGDLVIALAADEENLSSGTYALLQRGLRADMAVMAECRFAEMAIGFRGRVSMQAEVSGLAAHAARYPKVGRNAVIDAARLAIAVEALPTAQHLEAGAGTWCVRHIEGGVKHTLTVPDRCSLFIDRYLVPGETLEGCIEQVAQAAESLGMGGRVNVAPTQKPTPFMQGFVIPRDHELVESTCRHFREIVGEEPMLVVDPSVCDANYLAVIGNIPTLTFGPSGKGLHGPNEYGSIREVRHCTEIYLRLMEEFLS